MAALWLRVAAGAEIVQAAVVGLCADPTRCMEAARRCPLAGEAVGQSWHWSRRARAGRRERASTVEGRRGT